MKCRAFAAACRRIGLLLVGLSGSLGGPPLAAAETTLSPDSAIQFNRDVRPILANHCYACHGPDAHARKADLRLDVRTSAVGKAEDSAAIVPGKPLESELVRRIQSDDPDQVMPPPDHRKPLSKRQQQLLVRWIAQGAKYERHWSFVPPRRVSLPKVTRPHWPANPIDHFILDRLEQARLGPSPAARRSTLIRRVTLDLTGLPPTPAAVRAFLDDKRSDAYERVVDRLMQSTAYAERRAQDWLDLARYADTRGYADDKQRAIWPWRDWVVRAIDRNIPFDQFTVEQLAGDLLPKATQEQRLPTGFLRNAPQARGETYPVEEYRVQGVIDRVNTIGRVWLGLTLDCAQCHDHKFDPLTQRDYYSLFAIFNNTEHGGSGFAQGGPTMAYRLPSPIEDADRDAGAARARRRLEAQLAAARRKLPTPRPLAPDRLLGKWTGPTVVTDPRRFSLTGNLTITARIQTTQPVADIVSKYDWRARQRSYVFGIGGERDKGSLPGRLFFWVSARTDPFEGVTVIGSQPVNDDEPHHVAVEFVAGRSVRLFVDGIEDKRARQTGTVPKSIARSNRSLAIGAGYSGTATANAFRFQGRLQDVELSDQALGDAISIGSAGDEIVALRAALRKLEAARKRPVVPAVPVMRERSVARESFVHVRGNFLHRGPRVIPAAPAVFGFPKSRQPRNRLELARWLVSGRHPLVARVVVNRYWQSYFGRGLVETPDDFGAQGTPPSHPRLLDWLAAEFVESGWDRKHIHRLIVTSATYRQSARIERRARRMDPKNVLLGRMPRLRLPAEQIRDQALLVSGLLVDRVGGPPVFPPQPEGYWRQRVLPGTWQTSTGGDRYRKTIYTYWRRMALHPTLELLNAPPRENCVVRRDVSNLPTQALALMNDPIFHEAARAFAARVLRESEADDAKRLDRAFRHVLARTPAADEREQFLRYLARQRKDFATDPAGVRALAGAGAGKRTRAARAVDLAAWTLTCGVLLNLDEALTRP